MSVSTHVMRSFMAPPVRMDHTLNSSGVNPTCGPVMATITQRALMISVRSTDVHLFLWNIMDKGVWMVAP